MNAIPLRQLDSRTDDLVNIAFSENRGSGEVATERLITLSQALGHTTAAAWESETHYLVKGLRTASFLACLPSLVTVAGSQPHTRTVAEAVSGNLQEFSQRILATDSLQPQTIYTRQGRNTHSLAMGQYSEIAVLGLLWWGIAHDRAETGTFALPATKQQDTGKRQDSGYRRAADIILHKSDSRRRDLVQVKHAHTKQFSAKLNNYEPGTIVVTISHLRSDNKRADAEVLLRALANNQSGRLHRMFSRFEESADQATLIANLHREFLHREQERPQHIVLKKDRLAARRKAAAN